MSEKRIPITPREWAEIEELWAMGDVTLDDLANRYRSTPTYLSRQLSERGIKKGSKAAALKAQIQERVHEQQMQGSVEILRRIDETKEEHYKYAQTLSKLIFKLVAKQIQEKRPVSGIKDDIKTLRDALQALQIARNERWVTLGLDKDANTGQETTTLIVQEMTAEDEQAVRDKGRRSSLEDDVAAVEAVIQKLEKDTPEDQVSESKSLVSEASGG
jgi:hypothetical protein